MSPSSLYFYYEYVLVYLVKRLSFYLFGVKGENFVNKGIIRFFECKNKFLNRSKNKRSTNIRKEDCFFRDNEIRERKITIIIPIYNAYEELKECLDSIIYKTQCPYRLLLIDDASTDARIRPFLDSFSKMFSHVMVLFNNKNMGYTATINRGCLQADSDDVVLLNSDTQVTKNWLKKMSNCSKDDPRVATVTPISNAAGVFSVPLRNVNNKLPSRMSIDKMGELVERLSLRKRPMAPTGSGFCMYITRNALDSTGFFDEKSFPKGYGEENDFCARALKKGFIHLIDDTTYIYHRRSSSFRVTKKKILSASMRRLNILHPEYKFLVLKWMMNDPLDEFRKLLLKEIESNWQYENSI